MSNAKTKEARKAPSLRSDELFLVRQYVRYGAVEDKLSLAARRARMTEQHARTLLKRPHVQAELALQKQILRHEQAKIDAADISREVEETDVLCRETERRAMHRLNALIETDPKDLKAAHTIHMEVLKLALVVAGTIRSGRNGTERLAPPDGSGAGGGSSTVPGSFFERGMMGAAKAAPLFGAGADAPVNEGKSEEVKSASVSASVSVSVPAAVEEPLEPLEVKVGKKAGKQ